MKRWILIVVMLLGLVASGVFNVTQNFKNQELDYENEQQYLLVKQLQTENDALVSDLDGTKADLVAANASLQQVGREFNQAKADAKQAKADLAMVNPEKIEADKEAAFWDGLVTACMNIFTVNTGMTGYDLAEFCAKYAAGGAQYDIYPSNIFLDVFHDYYLSTTPVEQPEPEPTPTPSHKLPNLNS